MNIVEPFPGGNGSADTGVQTRVIAQRAMQVLNALISNTVSRRNGCDKESPSWNGSSPELTGKRTGLEPGHVQHACDMYTGDIDD